MPFMAASACILAWSALRRREILAGSLVCLIVALFVCGKAITYQREYILYSSVTFRQDAVTTEVAKTIARLSHGQEKNALAPTAVLTSAIGIMFPELHFLSIPVVDLHLLPNSIYKDQLEERTMLNKLVNGDDSVDRKRLDRYIDKLDYIVTYANCEMKMDAFLREKHHYVKHYVNDGNNIIIYEKNDASRDFS